MERERIPTEADIQAIQAFLTTLEELEAEEPKIDPADFEKSFKYFQEHGENAPEYIDRFKWEELPNTEDKTSNPDTEDFLTSLGMNTLEETEEDPDHDYIVTFSPEREAWEEKVTSFYRSSVNAPFMYFLKNNFKNETIENLLLDPEHDYFTQLSMWELTGFNEADGIARPIIKKSPEAAACFHSLTVKEALQRIEAIYKRNIQNLNNKISEVGLISNTSLVNAFFQILATGDNLERLGNNIRIREENRNGQRITVFTQETNNKKIELSITNLDKLTYKRSIITVKMFCFCMQKLAISPYDDQIEFNLNELVEIGLYNTVEHAREGAIKFYNYMTGQTDGAAIHIDGVTHKTGKNKGKHDKGGFLFQEHDITDNYVIYNIKRDLKKTMFSEFFTYFPKWAYKLDNVRAFSLVRYICYLTRQQGGRFEEPAFQIPGRERKTFNVSIKSICENIGLPTVQEVAEKRNRRYKDYIITPLEKAIEEIETIILETPPEEAYILTLTPIGIDTARNIHEFLSCSLEVGISSEKANSIIEIEKKHKEEQAKFQRMIEAARAKNAAKSPK